MKNIKDAKVDDVVVFTGKGVFCEWLSGNKYTITEIQKDICFESGIGFSVDPKIDDWVIIDSSFFETCDPPKQEAPFKLGKYKTQLGRAVDIVATHEHFAWGVTSDGVMDTFKQDSLKPVAKFDHLRNLPQDTNVIVWNDKNDRHNRHFKFVNESGDLVFCYPDGKTSFSADYDEGLEAWRNCELFVGSQ